jgi:DHA1 family multidrug resistance protein-like MFS transporter
MSHLPLSLPAETSPIQPLTYVQRNEAYWRRNLAVAVFGSFSTAVSLTMLLPILPQYVEQLGAGSQAAVIRWSGIAFGATFLGTGLTSPLWGRLADRFGRKTMLVRAALGMTVFMSLIGLAHSVYQLVALRLLAGLVGGYNSAATMMVGTQAPTTRAGWALGVLSTGAVAGSLLGPLVGGLLPGWIGIRATFFAGGGIIATAALLTILFVREEFDPAQDGRRQTETTHAARPQRSNPAIVAVLILTATMVLLANMSIEPIITVYIAEIGVHGDGLTRIAGVVMACSALGSMLTAPRLGALADRVGSWKVIVGCLAVTGLVMFPQALVTNWWELAGLRLLMGMSLAGLLPAINKLARQVVAEAGAGQMLGYLQSAQSAGMVLGPLLGGAIGVHLGLGSVFYLTGALLAGCALVAEWARRQ